jgi:hypothetical protein
MTCPFVIKVKKQRINTLPQPQGLAKKPGISGTKEKSGGDPAVLG